VDRPKPDYDADGVDVGLIRWMLGLTPEERLDVLQGFVDSVGELRDGQGDSDLPALIQMKETTNRDKDRAVLAILKQTLAEKTKA
jgi:hypothetical protein